MTEKKQNILRNVLIYVPSKYFSQFLGFFTSLLMKRFLGPFNAGIWNLLRLVIQYVNYTELGSTLAVYYKVPFYGGKGDEAEADKVKNSVFTFVMICSFMASVLIALFALIFARGLPREIFYGLLVVSVIILFERIYTFYVMLLRAKKNYKVLSRSVYFDAVVNLSLILLIVSRFRLYGLFAVAVIVPVVNILFIRHYADYKVSFMLDVKRVVSYIKFGFPIYLTSILVMLLNSIDRIMIVSMLGIQQLGFYSIALMAKSYGHQMSTSFTHVTSPHFMEDYGKHGDSEILSSYFIKGTFAVSSFMSVVLGMIFIFAFPVVNTVLPSFSPGLTPLRIFLLTSFFASLVSFPKNYIVTLEKQSRLILFVSVALVMNVILNYTLIRGGLGITGAAIATAISSFTYLAMISIYGLKHFARGLEIPGYFLKIFFPCAYSAIVVLLLEKYVVYPSMWIGSFFKAGLFLLASVTTVVLLERETGLVRVFADIVKKKFSSEGGAG